ncbi:hypothetical protein LguiA_007283 [Lonicera macranthoides]
MTTSEIPIIVKLDGNNYNHWSMLFRNFLKGKGLWKYVTGKESCPMETDAKFEEWEINNNKILTWLANTVIPSISIQLGRCTTAKKAWDFLAQRYVQTNFAKKYKLEQDIRSLQQQPGQTVSDFHSSMCLIWDQLELMEPQWTVDMNLWETFREETRLVQFLMALRDEFEPIRAFMLHRKPLPSIEEALSELSILKLTATLFVSTSNKGISCYHTSLPSFR